jgi:hypothetical protein
MKNQMIKPELSEGQKKVLKVLGIIGTVIYFLSFIPYFFMIQSAIEGVSAGLFGGPHLYGWEAAVNTFVWLCIIPIYPICFLYELLFFIFYIRKKTKILSFVSLGLVLALIIGIFIPCILFGGKKRSSIAAQTPKIKAYLSERYGEEVSSNIKIELVDYDEGEYKIYSSILPDSIYFSLYRSDSLDSEYEYADDLVNTYLGQNDNFQKDYNEYLKKSLNLPEYITPSAQILSIDFTGYKFGDDYEKLFSSVDYNLYSFIVDREELDDNTVVNITRDFWKNTLSKMTDKLNKYVMLHMSINGSFAYDVQVDLPADYNNYNATMKISLYKPAIVESELEGQVLFIEG